MERRHPWWRIAVKILVSSPGPVRLINSMLAGVFVGLIVVGFFSVELIPGIIIALVALVLALGLQMSYAAHVWRRETERNVEVRFPPPQD